MSYLAHRPSPRMLAATVGIGAVVALTVFGGLPAAFAADPGDDDFLGTAESFAIVATVTITDAGLASQVIGDVALTSVAPGAMQLVEDQDIVGGQVINGTIHVDSPTPDAVAMQAVADVGAAYTGLSALPVTETVGSVDLALIVGHQVGTEVVYEPGVYASGSMLLIDGQIVLDGLNDPNSVFVFRAESSLTAGTGASIVLRNGAQACNVYWRVLSDATIEAGVQFAGTVIAGGSIWAHTGAVVDGQLLAGALGAGEVTLDHNTIDAQTSCVRSTTADGVTTTTTRVDGTTTTTTTPAGPTVPPVTLPTTPASPADTAGVGGATALAETGSELGLLPIGVVLTVLLGAGFIAFGCREQHNT